MPTLTRKAKTVKFSTEFVSITIRINDVRYAVDPIAPGEDGTRAFRLCKASGDHEVYDVIRTHSGICECSCPDYEARHRGNGHGMCKHGRAMVELGLMPGPVAPADIFRDATKNVPTPAPCCSPSEPLPCTACVEAPEPAPEPLDVEYPPVDLTTIGETFREIPEALPGEMVDPGDAESDPVLWSEEWDADVWSLGPDPDAATLDLAELVDRQAAAYRAWPLEAGEMIARALDELALKVRMTGATTPAEYEARIEVIDADIRSDWEARGYDRAMEESGERAALAGHFGHPA